MSLTNETREVYNTLQNINLESVEPWSNRRSEIDKWSRFEDKSDDESQEVSQFFHSYLTYIKCLL
jgi:hypothetical protein